MLRVVAWAVGGAAGVFVWHATVARVARWRDASRPSIHSVFTHTPHHTKSALGSRGRDIFGVVDRIRIKRGYTWTGLE